jgi:H+-transporting ATPase
MESTGLSSPEALKLREKYGWNEVSEKKRHAFIIFIKKFWGLSAWMIEIIAIVSLILHKTSDFVIALGLLLINSTISFFEEQRTESVVQLLKNRLQILARVLRDEKWQQLPSRELVPEDIIRVHLGDVAPADIKILLGEVLVDQSILTGESREINKSMGDTIYSGSLIRRGEATGKVIATGKSTYFGKTIELVQSAYVRPHMDEVVSKLVRYLLVIIGSLVVFTATVSLIQGHALSEVLPLSLILLMSAVPITLPVMFTISTAIAASVLGKKGVLVTHLNAAQDVANMTMLFVDKTGTITQNKLRLKNIVPRDSCEEQELMIYAALASDKANNDALDFFFSRNEKN